MTTSKEPMNSDSPAGLMVPVLPSTNVRAWPKNPDDGAVARYTTLTRALTDTHATDAHFAGYSVPTIARRLDSDAPAALAEIGGVPMVLLVVDVDCPDAHRENGSTPETWREEQRERIDALRARHPEFFVYLTKGGYRIVAQLARPHMIQGERNSDSVRAWRRWYVLRLGYLWRAFGIEADPSCRDWTRLYRLPRATRTPGGAPESWPIYGNAPGVWSFTADDAADHEALGTLAERDEAARRDHRGHNPWSDALKHAGGVAPPTPLLEVRALETPRAMVGAGNETSRARRRLDEVLPILCAEVRDAPDGAQNNTLRDRALRGFRLALAAGEDLDMVAGAMRDAARAGRHPAARTDATIASSLEFARRAGPAPLPERDPPPVRVRPSKRPAQAPRDARVRVEEQPAAEDLTAPRPNTDQGNGERLVRAHGRDLMHTSEGTWRVYDGRRFAIDEGEVEVMRRAKRTARAIVTEDQPDRGAQLKHALRSESASALAAMVRLASTEPDVAVNIADLDADTMLLNCLNGTIDLRTGEMRPHRREDRITKLCPVNYDPTATCEVWERFLDAALDGHTPEGREVIDALQRWAGYCLTGDTREHAFVFIGGPGGSGKSTFIESIKAVLGDYAATINFELLLKQPHGRGLGATPDVAKLRGARLVASAESARGRHFDEGFIKEITGGEEVSARELYQRSMKFKPQFKLMVASNFDPQADDDDSGFWRRCRRIEFPHGRPNEGDRDPSIQHALTDPAVSGAGILAWAVRGCLAWQSGGLKTPAAVAALTNAYRAKNDPLAEFLAARVVIDRGAVVARKHMRNAYESWVQDCGTGAPLSGKRFGERLRARLALELGADWRAETTTRTGGYSNPVDAWRGVRLRESGEPLGDGLDGDDETPGEVCRANVGRTEDTSPKLSQIDSHMENLGESPKSALQTPYSDESPTDARETVMEFPL